MLLTNFDNAWLGVRKFDLLHKYPVFFDLLAITHHPFLFVCNIALSSIFVVTENDIGREEQVEAWAAYNDIFVRNAFGSFFDILKEVSFSPLMGEMLTYKGQWRLWLC